VSKERWNRFSASHKELNGALEVMESTSLSPEKWSKYGINVNSDGVMRRFVECISRWVSYHQ
jgi:hypothetical protein